MENFGFSINCPKLETMDSKPFDFFDKNQIRHLLSSIDKFVPYQMLDLLGKRTIMDVRLGDHVEREVTILFTDIRDFTTLSESMSPRTISSS